MSVLVVERVVLLTAVHYSVVASLSNSILDLVGVDDAVDVRVGDFVAGKVPALLLVGGILMSSEHIV